MVVHILLGGVTLCGVTEVPKDWPKGDRWVSVQDAGEGNCVPCFESLVKNQENIARILREDVSEAVEAARTKMASLSAS